MKGVIILFLAFVSAVASTAVSIEMFTAGATTAITLLCTGTKVRKRK